MQTRNKVFILFWLGIFSSQLMFSAEPCKNDSVIGYSENSTPISKTLYQYDEAGRTIQEERWYANSDSVLIGSYKTTKEYYPNGKEKSTASYKWSDSTQNWAGSSKQSYVYNEQGLTDTRQEYVWSTTTNDWRDSVKYEYTYNSKGSQLSSSVVLWSVDKQIWQNSSKSEYVYDEANRKIQETYYVGEGATWTPRSKQECSYDIFGNKTLEVSYSGYDEGTKTWIGNYKNIDQYNDKNRLVLTERYTWDQSVNKWKGTAKTEYGYNAKGATTMYVFYAWDKEKYDFVGTSKIINDFDQWNNTILNEQYTWGNGQWRGTGKIRHEYTAQNSDPIMTATFAWDSVRNVFIGVDSIRLAKDEAENQILDERYQYDTTQMAWQGTKKEEKIFDAAKNIISKRTYQWLKDSADWIYATKDSAAFDENKNTILKEAYKWNSKENYWVGQGEKLVSEYTNNKATLQEVYIWQAEEKDWTYKSKKIKAYDGNLLLLDEEYQLTNNVLVGTKKEKYAYNANKETILTVKYKWLHDYEWQGTDSILADYKNKNQILNEKYTWDTLGGYWHGTEKATYTFNSNKQQTSSWVYAWNDSTIAWDYSSRDTASYDAKKNQTLDERYNYDKEQQLWIGEIKKEYKYNAQGQQIMFAYYDWDSTAVQFVGRQKEEKELDSQNRITLFASYTWGETDWQGEKKNTYVYFRNDTVAEKVTYEWKATTWVEESKQTDAYSPEGKHTATTNYTWQGGWVGTLQTLWTYNEGGKAVGYIQQKWNNTDWENVEKWEKKDANTEYTYEWYNADWSKSKEVSKTYDQGLLKQELIQNWSKGVATTGNKVEYTYQNSKLTQKSTYNYISGSGQWDETKRQTNEYNASGLTTLTKDENLKDGSGSKTTNTYDEENRLTNTTKQSCTNYVWQNVSKTDNEYSSNLTVTSNWEWKNAQWEGTTKQEIELGEGKDRTITQYEWEDGNWEGKSKTGYTYYPSGKDKDIITYMWSKGQWVPDFRTEYEYSGSSRNTITATYEWKDDAWVGKTKTGLYYDEGEALTTATWEWKNQEWVGKSKLGETYDALGNRTGQTTYSWTNKQFVYKQKTEIEYGISKNDKTTAVYVWNVGSGTWQGQSKKGVTYNGSKLSSETTYTWLSGFNWRNNTKTEYEYGTHANDKTTAVYEWDVENEKWKGKSKAGVTYASNGNKASEFSYVWGDSCWLNQQKTEWGYGDGKDNSIAQYIGQDTTWVGVSKIAETYTNTGDSLGLYTYCWKNNAWADSLKTEYTYDDDKNIIYYIQAQMVGDTWYNLATSKRWELVYDENDSLIVDAHYKWSTSKRDWIGTGTRYTYTYTNNKLTLKMLYKWDSGKWTYDYENAWEYDENDYLTMSSYRQYSTAKRSWLFGSKDEYGYSPSGIRTMNANYTWNSNNGKWQGISKTEDVLDDRDSVVANISYAWNYTNWGWQGSFKYEYKYDEQGRTLEQVISRYNTTLQEWRYDTQNTYEYDAYGRTIESRSNVWTNDRWLMRTIDKYTYEQDPYTRLRVHLTGTWSDGVIQKYEEQVYYYGCDPKFEIKVTTQDEVGEVSGSGTYTYYARPQVAAIVDAQCNTFVQWNDSSTSQKRRVIVTSDSMFVALFTRVEHTVGVKVNEPTMGAATIAKNDEAVSTTGEVTGVCGDTVTLEATPAKGFRFLYWDDNHQLTSPTRRLALGDTATRSEYKAMFATNIYYVSVTTTQPDMGSVTGSGNYDLGTPMQITATPKNQCYRFVQWNDGNTDSLRTIIVADQDSLNSYVAEFEATNYSDPVPVVWLYEQILMVNVDSLKRMGYVFAEEDVNWWVGSDVVATGYYYVHKQVNPNQCYVTIDVSATPAATILLCKDTLYGRYNMRIQPTPTTIPLRLIPNMTQPGSTMQVSGLSSDTHYTIQVFDAMGRKTDEYTAFGDNYSTIVAQRLPGYYVVRIVSDTQEQVLRYIVK